MLFLLLGVSCEELSPDKNEESSLEDSTVTLSYTYSKQADGNDHFFWYRQYPGKPPEFLFYISGLNTYHHDRGQVGDLTNNLLTSITSLASAAPTEL
uniref:Immunoglobulin V-set domain-containing protein n=1 Tax=Sparus aurata TaxID=8175 RepID=A0A671U107_SPAAU